MATETRTDNEKSLDEIRREVIESRNLVIKNDNLLKNLHAELKLVTKRHEEFQKRAWVTSGVTYVAFALLCAAAAYSLSGARASAVSSDKDRLEKQVADLSSQVEKYKSEAHTVEENERAASDAYRQMSTLTGDDRLKGVEILAQIDTTRLSALTRAALHDRGVAIKKEIAATALEKGKAAFRKNEFPVAIEELNKFMKLSASDAEMAEASYYLGNSYMQTRKHEEAIPHLQRFIQFDKRVKGRDFAMTLLMQCYGMLGQNDKAADVAKEALAAYPNSEFQAQFRLRLARKPATAAPTAPAPKPAAVVAPAEATRTPLKPAAPTPVPAKTNP